jgi:hypothetical protein
MDLDTFLTTLYVHVDDWYKAEGAALVARRQAGRLRMSDSEVLTLAILEQWEAGTPWCSERGLVRYVQAHGRSWFPSMLKVSAYNWRVRQLCTALAALQRWFARRLGSASACYEIMDGFPLPVCSLSQVQRDKQHWLGQVSSRGHGGTQGGWFYGQRWWMSVTPQGAIGDWLVAAAHIGERWVLDTLLAVRSRVEPSNPPEDTHQPLALRPERPQGFIGGYFAAASTGSPQPILLDRGLNGQRWQDHWASAYGATTLSVPPKNTPEYQDWTRDDCKAVASHRQVVETVFSNLTTVLGAKHTRAHSLWGQYTRLAAKAAAFNFGLLLNRQLDRPPFSLATLIT